MDEYMVFRGNPDDDDDSELAEDIREVERVMQAIIDLMNRKSDKCPICGSVVESMQQSVRSVYGIPCGCRMYAGMVPEIWRDSD